MKNPIYIDGDTCRIICERRDGEVYEVIIDTADLMLVAAHPGRWNVGHFGHKKEPYCIGHIPLGRKDKHKNVLLHRLLMGEPKRPNVVDHKNGNGLDNRRSNLQVISHADNLKKSKLTDQSGRRKKPISGFKGVHKHCRNDPFFYGVVAGKYLGTFKTAKEAAKVVAEERERENYERWGKYEAA